jgi:hypothetical protein
MGAGCSVGILALFQTSAGMIVLQMLRTLSTADEKHEHTLTETLLIAILKA